MKLLAIDYKWSFEPADYTDFAGNISCYDYDVVIWDPAHSFDLFNEFDYYASGDKSLTKRQSRDLLVALTRRRREFEDFLKMGNTLYVLARHPNSAVIHNGTVEREGKGRSAVIVNHTETVKPLSALPITLETMPASGKNFEVIGDGIFQQLLRRFSSDLRYEAVISGPGTAIARIPNTQRTLGAVAKLKSGGQIVLIPVPKFAELPGERTLLDYYDAESADDEGEGDQLLALAMEFQHGLIDSASRLSGAAEEQPEWAKGIRLHGEAEIIDDIEAKKLRIAELQSELTTLSDDLGRIEYLKNLVSGTGRALELAVKEVLEILGGRVEEPEPGRDDWIVHFPERVAVVEVKGLGKSAGEKNATQLEKWVINYHDRHEIFPKGILVINAWRNKPLSDRNEKAFPDQMLPYCERSDHCLITGAQMLAIHQHVLRNPGAAGEIRQSLLATAGRFSNFADVDFGLSKIADEEPLSQ
ncbi:hypothetical protein APR11_000024 [Nocardia amikacinitolerans]|uniref:hypothetical protein n=1 Tax=Nocardia amikacinitolerans TaxID=756689 RepID=UPI0020A5D51C|nr:hypothetical protein [Nocardia amikacinitolerans]MCP2293620.1 hypothetical protein [Nocardia amikacinitolerans]